MDKLTDELETAEIVFVGAATLQGGSIGSIFVPLRLFEEFEASGNDFARMIRSPYKDKPNRVIGGVYSARAKIDGDSIAQLGKSLTFLRRIDHPIVQRWEIQSKAIELAGKKAQLEKRAKSNLAIVPEIQNLARLLTNSGSDRPMMELVIMELIRREGLRQMADRRTARKS